MIFYYLASIGYKPKFQRGNNFWFCSPFRQEKHPSFKINAKKNIWIDFGLTNHKRGGNLVDFVALYNHVSIPEALRILSTNKINPHISFSPNQQEPKQTRINIKRISPLRNPLLIDYVESRKIPIEIAEKNSLMEIYYYINQYKFFGVGMKNDKGGYEIRNKLKYGKISSSPKYITTIKGKAG